MLIYTLNVFIHISRSVLGLYTSFALSFYFCFSDFNFIINFNIYIVLNGIIHNHYRCSHYPPHRKR